MTRVIVTCDRCHKVVKGLRLAGGTSGFYEGPLWEEYMNKGELTLCDACMQESPRYQAGYGVVTSEKG